MLIDLKEIINKYNLNIKGVIQVGCHYCQEHKTFVEIGVNKFVYIEPCKDAFDKAVENVFGNKLDGSEISNGSHPIFKSDNYLFANVACGKEYQKEAKMYASLNNQGQSNSLLQPNLHLLQHPEIIFTWHETVTIIRLDDLHFEQEDYNLLMMDAQGFEGEVLKGATETLKHIDCIYTEVNRDFTYSENMLVHEMDDYLANFGFARIKTYWPSPNLSWGDACYILESLL